MNLTAPELAAYVARSRAAQGLPPTITDLSILTTIATLTKKP